MINPANNHKEQQYWSKMEEYVILLNERYKTFWNIIKRYRNGPIEAERNFTDSIMFFNCIIIIWFNYLHHHKYQRKIKRNGWCFIFRRPNYKKWVSFNIRILINSYIILSTMSILKVRFKEPKFAHRDWFFFRIYRTNFGLKIAISILIFE